jgi:hypothetical protein
MRLLIKVTLTFVFSLIISSCGGGDESVVAPPPVPIASLPVDVLPSVAYASGIVKPDGPNGSPVVTKGGFKLSHRRELIKDRLSQHTEQDGTTLSLPTLAGLAVNDTVEFSDIIVRVTNSVGNSKYQFQEATPFDVFSGLEISSRRTPPSGNSLLGSKSVQNKAQEKVTATQLKKWLSFGDFVATGATKIYPVAKEFFDCTTLASVLVNGRPSIHTAGFATFPGYEFAADNCKIFEDSTGSVLLDQKLALGSEGDFSIDVDNLTFDFKVDGAYSYLSRLTLSAAGTSKDKYRLLNLIPDFLNPDSKAEYPELVMSLRKMLRINVYLDLVIYRELRSASAQAEISGAGDFAFGGKVRYDPSTKKASFVPYMLTNGKRTDADPAASKLQVQVNQFDARLGAGLQLGYAINFAQTTADGTQAVISQLIGTTAADLVTSGISADLSFTALAMVGVGSMLDMNVGKNVTAPNCRFSLVGSLAYNNLYNFQYRAGALADTFEYRDGPQFMFTNPEGEFLIRDFVANPTSLIDGSEYCGERTLLQAATAGRPKLVFKNNVTGKSYSVNSVGDISQISAVPVRDIENYSIEVDTSEISRSRTEGGITFAWTSSDLSKVGIVAPNTAEVGIFLGCKLDCPSPVTLTAKVVFGSSTVNLPIKIPLDNYAYARSSYNYSSNGLIFDASATTDTGELIKEYVWISANGLIVKSLTPRVTLPATSPFVAELLASNRAPSIRVTDSRGQVSITGVVFDPALEIAGIANTIVISAASFLPSSVSIAVKVTSACDGGLVMNAPPYTSTPNVGEWAVPISVPGNYRIEVEYTAATSRPVEALIDGTLINSNALADTTGSWCATPSISRTVGTVSLTAGNHVFRLQRGDVFPHLKEIRFIPSSGTPNATNLFAGLQVQTSTLCGSDCLGSKATDGNLSTAANLKQNTGNFVVQSPAPLNLSAVRLIPDMSPNGNMDIEIRSTTNASLATGAIGWQTHFRGTIAMSRLNSTMIPLTSQAANARQVEIIVHSSPSWVAFFEIEGYAGSSGTFAVAANNPSGTLFAVPAGASSCTFNASGTWNYGTGLSAGPGGTSVSGFQWLLPSAQPVSLIVKRGSTFESIGVSKTISTQAAETLYFMINEAAVNAVYSDNSGAISVSYQCQ